MKTLPETNIEPEIGAWKMHVLGWPSCRCELVLLFVSGSVYLKKIRNKKENQLLT